MRPHITQSEIGAGRTQWNKKKAGHNMAIVGEPRNVNTHANNPESIHDYVVPTAVCTLVLYTCTHWLWLYSCLVDRSEHRIHLGDTTHTWHTHTHIWHRQSQMLSKGSPPKKNSRKVQCSIRIKQIYCTLSCLKSSGLVKTIYSTKTFVDISNTQQMQR